MVLILPGAHRSWNSWNNWGGGGGGGGGHPPVLNKMNFFNKHSKIVNPSTGLTSSILLDLKHYLLIYTIVIICHRS